MSQTLSFSTCKPRISPKIGNKYGFFDQEKNEFVILRPDTPKPWVNYLTNGRYSGLISHAGGGFSFYISPKDSRITRWRYNSLPHDRPGRYIYFRDRESREYWSATWQPTPSRNYANYECRHGMNYTTISLECNDIRSECTFFVSPADDVELWWIRLKNTGAISRSIDVYSFVELCLGHALVDLINQPNDKHFNDVHFLKNSQVLMASKRYWVTFNKATVAQANKAWNKWVFVSSSLSVEGFDGSKDEFIGPWRSEENPRNIENGVSGDTEITAGDAIASLRCPLEIAPGEEKEFCFCMGVVDKFGDEAEDTAKSETLALRLAEKYRDMKNVRAQFDAVIAARDEYLSACQIETPDPEMNLFINFWNQYQTRTTFQFSRDAGYYHGGLLFGRGYRDSCQDALGPLFSRPDWVRARILEMAGRQFSDGSVYHSYYPMTGGGETTGHSDTPLWLPLIVMEYLKETGDFELLEEVIPYDDGGEDTLLGHIIRAVDLLKSRLNEDYLVYIGPGDWNDTLDYCGRGGKGVSAMNTFIYAYILKEMTKLLERLDDVRGDDYRKLHICIKESVNKVLWDGEWYIRAINDKGEKVGSSECREGKIFINAQSWAVISGIAEGERAVKCMNAVEKYCGAPKGPKIMDPPYTRVDGNIGLATRCVPGKKENGAVFNHAVSWAYLAELKMKNAERAYKYYRQALPINPVIEIDRYEVEPYVYAEYVTSPDHSAFGQASHSWLTGSSVWMLRNTIDYLMGVRPSYDGLLIDPCLPPEWESCRMIRRFRGAIFDITFERTSCAGNTVKSLSMDGKVIEGNIIPVMNDEGNHIVKVTL